jgi:hypothetical protein
MGQTDASLTPPGDVPPPEASAGGGPANPGPSPRQPEEPPVVSHHDFDAQKRIHQQIRNDPDYDDWEYGTEPLPHEAWKAGSRQPAPQGDPTG